MVAIRGESTLCLSVSLLIAKVNRNYFNAFFLLKRRHIMSVNEMAWSVFCDANVIEFCKISKNKSLKFNLLCSVSLSKG